MNSILASFRERVLPPSPPAPPTKDAAAMAAVQSQPIVSRPYAPRDAAPQIPPRSFCEEVLGRGEVGDLIPADERKALRQDERKIARITRELQDLDFRGIREAVKGARWKLERGRGSSADAALQKNNLLHARKALKRQRAMLIEAANPRLEVVAARVEAVARRVLPTIEAEARRLGIDPGYVPMVVQCAFLTWSPTECARSNIYNPKGFLRRLGIKL